MSTWQTTAVLLAAYLLGSVSFAWLFAKALKGVDLRTIGSGNLGATNAGRLLGHRMAVVVYLLDFAKGALPVILVRELAGNPLVASAAPVALLAGVAAFVGHCFPVWHGFRGGKGVATASGVVVAHTPLVALVAFLVFGFAVAVSKRISVGSLAAAVALPVAYAVLPGESRSPWTLGAYAFIASLVGVKHRANIGRLLRGEEPKIGARK